MSLSITLSNTSSVLEAHFFPPIILEGNYEIGLISFLSYNSIPNIDITNNRFHFDGEKYIEIPIGSYEIVDIDKTINAEIKKKYKNDETQLRISINDNTLTCKVHCTKQVYFNKYRSIGSLLGFINCEAAANTDLESNAPINIMKVNSIRVECNIASSSFLNGQPDHSIHDFFPNCRIGYKIIEIPKNIIYSSVTAQSIDYLNLKIVDQSSRLIDFRGEIITIRVHLRKC